VPPHPLAQRLCSAPPFVPHSVSDRLPLRRHSKSHFGHDQHHAIVSLTQDKVAVVAIHATPLLTAVEPPLL